MDQDISLSDVRRIVREMAARRPDAASRLDKAAPIIACREVVAVGTDLYRVGSWAERENTY